MDQLTVTSLPLAIVVEVIECLAPCSQSAFRASSCLTDEAFDAAASNFGAIACAATVRRSEHDVVDGDTQLRRWFPVSEPRTCNAEHHLRVHMGALVRWIGKESCDAVSRWGAGSVELHGFAKDTAIPHGFIGDSPQLKRLHFFGEPLKDVEDSVAHNIANNCPQLASVTSNGHPVEALTRLGHGWFTECYSLTSVDCRAFANVKSAGRGFMSYNTRQNTIELDFPRLQGVDDMFLAASGVDTVTFGPSLGNLLVVRNMCLWNATKLTRVTLQGLPALQVIGDLFLGLSTVRHVVMEDLPALSGIGVECMLECDQLQTAVFRNMPQLRAISDYWMAGCTQLQQLQIVGLNPDVRIGATMLTEANPDIVADVDDVVARVLPPAVKRVVV